MLVRCRSNRAREKLYKLVGRENITELWDWNDHYWLIPDEYGDEARRIKGVTKARVNRDSLYLTWNFT